MESVKDWVDGLYLQYSPKMVSTAMRAGFTAEEAEDLTQEVFLLFLTKAPMVRENYRSPGGYLFVTLRNLMGDALRQRRRRKTLSYGEVPDSGKDDVYFTSLRDALPSELDEKDREILIAYYEEEVGYEELAKRLDIPVGTVPGSRLPGKEPISKAHRRQKKFPGGGNKSPR